LALKAKAKADRRRARETPAVDQLAAANLEDLPWRELRVILHEELHRLPEKYRAPLLLCYWEGKTRDEAAAQLGVTANALKKYLERARNLLRGRLAGRGLVPSAAFIGLLLAEKGASAVVSSLLTTSTAKAAVEFATGNGVAAGIPNTAAVALAEGALRTMRMIEWAKTGLVVIFLAGLGSSRPMAKRKWIWSSCGRISDHTRPSRDAERIA
jgi:hypothetical protein